MLNDQKITQVTTAQKEPEREHRIATIKATQIIWLLFGIIEGLIAIRIVFKLIAANPESPIVSLIYKFTNLFLFPFAGMIGTPSAGGMVLEISSILALIIYALIAWVIVKLFLVIFFRPRGPNVQVTQTSSSEHRQ
jgi:hypothetical protein